jgi:hypothetical protein
MVENETYTHTLVPKQGISAAVKYTVTAYQENISIPECATTYKNLYFSFHTISVT